MSIISFPALKENNMLIRSWIFPLLILFPVAGILSSCSLNQTWLVKFNYHDREYSVRIKEVKDDLFVMARRQRQISTDLEWHKNYLFSRYLSGEIAVLEELGTEALPHNIDNSAHYAMVKKNALDSFRQKFRARFAATVLPQITDQVLQTYYNHNITATLSKQEDRTVQLPYAQVKQEIYEVVCEEYWSDYMKTWNEEMKEKYEVVYNEDGIHLLMDREAEYLNKIIQPKGTNLALYKPASASSALDNENSADMAFDGKQETVWIPAPNSSQQWITVDLGAKKPFKKVVLYWGKDFPASFTVQAADDGQKWRDIFLVNESTGSGNEVNEILLERTQKRFIKILINDNNGYTLRECEVYN